MPLASVVVDGSEVSHAPAPLSKHTVAPDKYPSIALPESCEVDIGVDVELDDEPPPPPPHAASDTAMEAAIASFVKRTLRIGFNFQVLFFNDCP